MYHRYHNISNSVRKELEAIQYELIEDSVPKKRSDSLLKKLLSDKVFKSLINGDNTITKDKGSK